MNVQISGQITQVCKLDDGRIDLSIFVVKTINFEFTYFNRMVNRSMLF